MRFSDDHHNDSHSNNYYNDTTNSSITNNSHISKLVTAASDTTALARCRDFFMRALRHTALPLITSSSSSSLGGNTAQGGNPNNNGPTASTHNIQRNPSPFTLRACAAHALVEGRYHEAYTLLHTAAAIAPGHGLAQRALALVTYLYAPFDYTQRAKKAGM